MKGSKIGFRQRNSLRYISKERVKSVAINISVFGDSHPEIANTYRNIGCVYYELKENNKAFEYFSKARDIYKLFYGDDHFKTIEVQERILSVQSLD